MTRFTDLLNQAKSDSNSEVVLTSMVHPSPEPLIWACCTDAWLHREAIREGQRNILKLAMAKMLNWVDWPLVDTAPRKYTDGPLLDCPALGHAIAVHRRPTDDAVQPLGRFRP